MKIAKLVPLSFVCTIVCLGMAQAAFSQSESLGIVRYTPVRGWTRTPKENVVAFSELNEKTRHFCIITLYGATPGSGNPEGDFSREWSKLVSSQFKAVENPQTDVQTADGWTITAGGAPIEAETGKSLAFLTVISGSGRTVSILAVFNDQAYVAQVDAFIKGIEMDKATVPANNTASVAPAYVNGKLVIPLPAGQLTITDLAGEWGEDAQRISTTYVYRDSGNYAGTDSLSFRSKMAFTRNGGYMNDFFAIRNGQKIIDKTVGTFAVNGRVLSIKHKGTAKYVIRGWLELPDMTILRVCGPWFDDDVIPENIFTNPDQGANLNKDWVRKK